MRSPLRRVAAYVGLDRVELGDPARALGRYFSAIAGGEEEYIPFHVCVRASTSGAAADIVFLAPTTSYMASADYRLAFHGDDCETICCRLTHWSWHPRWESTRTSTA